MNEKNHGGHARTIFCKGVSTAGPARRSGAVSIGRARGKSCPLPINGQAKPLLWRAGEISTLPRQKANLGGGARLRHLAVNRLGVTGILFIIGVISLYILTDY